MHSSIITSTILLLINAVSAQNTSAPSQISLAPAVASSLLSSACSVIVDGCPFAQTYCVSKYCTPTTATALGLGSCDTSGTCCSASSPQACLVSANLQNPCTNVANSFILCPTSAGAIASCLCSTGNFDGQASSCASLVSMGSYTDIASYLSGSTGLVGLCGRLKGNGTVSMTMSGSASGSMSSSGSASTTSSGASLTSGKSTPASTASAPSATKTSAAEGLREPMSFVLSSVLGAVFLSFFM